MRLGQFGGLFLNKKLGFLLEQNSQRWIFFPVSLLKKFKLSGSNRIHNGSSSSILMNSGCNSVIPVLPYLTCRIVFAPVGWTDSSVTFNQPLCSWKDTLMFSGRTVAMAFRESDEGFFFMGKKISLQSSWSWPSLSTISPSNILFGGSPMNSATNILFGWW